MLAYKKYITVNEPGQIVLNGLPFQTGQRVEVVLIAEDEDRNARIAELKTLFKRTQDLPASRSLSEQEIAEEVAEYRSGR
ncbi:MAG: hypothetical protein EPN22_13990 [Nitrospirae bacterium]|nr:MAG: hypothetical protein EPN22_13990 [Nitrospirota bacterium]